MPFQMGPTRMDSKKIRVLLEINLFLNLPY